MNCLHQGLQDEFKIVAKAPTTAFKSMKTDLTFPFKDKNSWLFERIVSLSSLCWVSAILRRENWETNKGEDLGLVDKQTNKEGLSFHKKPQFGAAYENYPDMPLKMQIRSLFSDIHV